MAGSDPIGCPSGGLSETPPCRNVGARGRTDSIEAAVEAIGILAAVIIALLLYRLRCRRRLWYGMVELAVAVTVIVLAFCGSARWPERASTLNRFANDARS